MKHSSIIRAIIIFLLAVAMAFETSARKIDSAKELVAYLYGCLYDAGAAADSIPAYDNAPLVRCNDEIAVNRSRLEFIDLMTGKYVASPQSFADNGIYGFYIMGQLPRQIHVFLKYGNEYTVLKPAKYGEYTVMTAKRQLEQTFEHFKNIKWNLHNPYDIDDMRMFAINYECLLPEYINAICSAIQYNMMYLDESDQKYIPIPPGDTVTEEMLSITTASPSLWEIYGIKRAVLLQNEKQNDK